MGEPFYSESGRVTNEAGQAHELADLEANKGRNVALAREKELKRISEGGLSDIEEKFVAVMEGMAEKYPDAFDRQIDGKGREFLRFRGGGDESADFFTQYGPLHIEWGGGGRGPGTEDVVDVAGYESGIRGGEIPPGIRSLSRWKMLDLTDPKQRERIKKQVALVQNMEEGYKKALKEKAVGAEDILADL